MQDEDGEGSMMKKKKAKCQKSYQDLSKHKIGRWDFGMKKYASPVFGEDKGGGRGTFS